jgi:valyl-tRNA synthetase
VYIHPTVLTKDGKRMSKSLGTGIDPMVLIEKYGADATRFGLAWYLTGGQDMRFSEDSAVMGKKFCNKIWNASRFIMFQISDSEIKIPKKLNLSSSRFTKHDRKILKALFSITKIVDKNLEKFNFGKVAQALYDFFWHEFCDKYLEESKIQIKNAKSKAEIENTKKVLLYVLASSLKLLHPFIPFVTEEIYQGLPLANKKKSLMIEAWPRI